MSIDLTITARNDGTGPADGMRVAELETALATLRSLGAGDDTMLVVVPNRAHRLRTLTATVPGTPERAMTLPDAPDGR